MNWKAIFSKDKKVRKKVLDQLSQTNGPIDASQITGGAQTGGTTTSDVGWLRSEASNDLKL